MIFISYSRENEDLVLPLVKLLRASGQNIFVDQQDLEYGADWRQQLAEAIRQSDRLLLFWSKSSQSSPFVREEWELALASPRCSIVPVILDRTHLPPELERFHGTTDMTLLFQALRWKRIAGKWLWLWWLGSAAVLAAVMSSVIRVMGPMDELSLFLLNFVTWVILTIIPVLGLWQLSLFRSKTLYRRAADSFGVMAESMA